jgi:hypothetical protein
VVATGAGVVTTGAGVVTTGAGVVTTGAGVVTGAGADVDTGAGDGELADKLPPDELVAAEPETVPPDGPHALNAHIASPANATIGPAVL